MEKKEFILGKKKISYYILPVGYTCNNNCRFCYNRGGKDIFPKLTFEDIKREIKKAKEKGYEAIVLFGGECTLRSDFFKILDLIKKAKLKLSLETNGRMFAYEDFVKKLAQYDLVCVQVSIHGHTSKLHDFLTQTPGSFIQTIQGIINLQKYFPELLITTYTVITKQNYQYLPLIGKFISEMGIRWLYFSFLDIRGRAIQFPSLIIPLQKVRPYLLETLSYLHSKNIRFTINKGPICILPEFHKNFQYEPYLLKNNFFLKDKVCQACIFNKRCVGFSKNYVKRFGFNEIRFGSLTKHELKFFFAGLNLEKIGQVEKFLKFDSRNNPILVIEKNISQNEIKEAIEKCKELGIPLLYLKKKNRLIDIWGDFRFTPSIVSQFLKKKRKVEKEELIKKILEQLNKDFGGQLTKDNLLLTVGARQALYLAFILLIKPGDKVIVFGNSWGGYRYGIETVGGKVIEVAWKEKIKNLTSQINKGVKMIVINNPYLPNLECLSQKYLRSLLNLCNHYKIYLVVDEIINRLLPKPFSVLSFANVEKDKLIVVNSFSKNYFIPHYRSGYLIAKKEIIQRAKKIIEFSNFQITQRSICASFAVLSGSQKWQRDLAKKIYEKGRY